MTDLVTLDTPFPIGQKHKGKPIGVVMQDRNYVDWFLSQENLVQRYAALANLLRGINNPDQDSCTPEHNSLQMLFMKPEYQEALARVLAPSAFVYGGKTHAEQLANSAKYQWPKTLEKPKSIEALQEARDNAWVALLLGIQELDNRSDITNLFDPLTFHWVSDRVSMYGLLVDDIAKDALEHPDILSQHAQWQAMFQLRIKGILSQLLTPNWNIYDGNPSANPANKFVKAYIRADNQLDHGVKLQAEYEANQAELARLEAELVEKLAAMPTDCSTLDTKTTLMLDIEFEHNNWDIALLSGAVEHHCQCGEYLTERHLYTGHYIELKPSISEDYPAILRKVKSRIGKLDGRHETGNKVVITREITASTATVEEVKAMFNMSGVTLLLLSEIEALIP